MRWRARITFAPPIAAALLLAAGSWAAAGQPNGSLDLTGSVPGGSSAESGKPMLGEPSHSATSEAGAARCAPPLPCGTRLLGNVRKNGALELQVPALRW